MKLTIPVYVEQEKKDDGIHFSVRALFVPGPTAHGVHLNRVLTRLAGRLTNHLSDLARDPHHGGLREASFAPVFVDRVLTIPVSLRDQTVKLRILLVVFDALDRTVAFSPQLPDVWFSVEGQQSLRERASDVYARHFKDLARQRGEEVRIHSDSISLKGKAWVTTVDVDLSPRQKRPEASKPFAFLASSRKPDGQFELNKVGRCLDWLYPDELDRTLFRDAEVARLARLLGDAQRRPVLIIGPPGVGKTALIHEELYRRIQARQGEGRSRENTWLLSPQRLISGMAYVGQWEERVLAILDAARERNHTLYFDDLVGLFYAGRTSQSQLSIAHVLKPYLERREIRVLAELTPEALRLLQELDRGFVDQFQVLRLHEPSLPETLRILIRVQQQLECKHGVRFELDCLPTVLDLQRRYGRDTAFPGKAAGFLRQLAVKNSDQPLRRDRVLHEFQRKSGLSLNLLDGRQRLERGEIVRALSAAIIGQTAAIEAFADAISIAKARLNDPGKPLAVYLFLGPTGVGKTQCAKALAEYLFGSSERLLRFDLNEYIDADAVMRLAGTAWNPDGQLTSAVRSQPFSVVLFDEIEKAHPSVTDLLLQVLGEGRLSDARGRTVDFTSTFIIMTSNLGVQEAHSTLGLKRADGVSDASVYVRAAERFFRPEFFNRIDRVVPFSRLNRSEIERIARLLIEGVFQRDGLVRRKCILQVYPAAMEKVIDEGYHPELGARALKRAIERLLTRPVGEYLAGIPPEVPTVISLSPAGTGVGVHVQPLLSAPPLRAETSQRGVLQRLPPAEIEVRGRTALARLERAVAALRPPGEIDNSPQYQHYFTLREAYTRLKETLSKLADSLRPARGRTRRPRAQTRPIRALAFDGLRHHWPALFAAEDIHEFVREFRDANEEIPESPLAERCLQHAAYIDALLMERESQRVVLVLRTVQDGQSALVQKPVALLKDAFASMGGIDASVLEGLEGGTGAILLEGYGAGRLSRHERGTCMVHGGRQGLVPIQVFTLQLEPKEAPLERAQRFLQSREEWLGELAAGKASPGDDPFRVEPVIRIFDERGCCVDLQADAVTEEAADPRDIRQFICGNLPPSPEFFDA